jgi:3',5'-cyclic AMP phosphodiesterase CpdA
MRTVVHLSDLHFGRTDQALIDPLLARVHSEKPDCVVVSGDLTQRARVQEFRAARAFLDRLPRPQVVVPGNHDVPLYRVLERMSRPLSMTRLP